MPTTEQSARASSSAATIPVPVATSSTRSPACGATARTNARRQRGSCQKLSAADSGRSGAAGRGTARAPRACAAIRYRGWRRPARRWMMASSSSLPIWKANDRCTAVMLDHRRLQRHRRSHRAPARARARLHRSCSSPAARIACARSPTRSARGARASSPSICSTTTRRERIREHVQRAPRAPGPARQQRRRLLARALRRRRL